MKTKYEKFRELIIKVRISRDSNYNITLRCENEAMLNILGGCCKTNILSINASKSNIVHFRNPSVTRSNFVFKVNEENVIHYRYLGLVLSEHLDYAFTAKVVAHSANRALGLLIAKTKAFGGLQYDAFTTLVKWCTNIIISHFII